MIFRRFPYTTLNDINLDWIIKQVKQIAAALLGKQDKPDLPGVAGQVLGLDDNLDPVWLDQGGGGGGTTNYNNLTSKPQINGVTLSGNKTAAELGLATPGNIPTGSLQLPLMDGTASAGESIARYSLEGHVHPENTNKVNVADIAIVIDGNVSLGAGDLGMWAIVKNSTISGVADGVYQLLKNVSVDTVVDATYFRAWPRGVLNHTVRTDTSNGVIDSYVDTAPQFNQYFRFAVRTDSVNYMVIFSALGVELYNLNTNVRERLVRWDESNVS